MGFHLVQSSVSRQTFPMVRDDSELSSEAIGSAESSKTVLVRDDVKSGIFFESISALAFCYLFTVLFWSSPALAVMDAPGSLHFNFQTDGNAEGWVPSGGLSLSGVSQGSLHAFVEAASPRLTRGRLYLESALIDGIAVRIKTTQPGVLILRWTHDSSSGESDTVSRSSAVSVAADNSEFRSIYFDLRNVANWKGKVITGLSFEAAFPVATELSFDVIYTSSDKDDRNDSPNMVRRSRGLSDWAFEQVIPHAGGNALMSWQTRQEEDKKRELFRSQIEELARMPSPTSNKISMIEKGGETTAYLDNGVLKLGAAASQGASIHFIAPSGENNLVNLYDPGRLIQQSYYAGDDVNRQSVGQSQHWSPWPWNPIQGGDASNQKSQVLEMRRLGSDQGFFTRTVPLLWDMTTGEKAEAWMDQWNQFEPDMPDVIRVTCRLTCFRNPADSWTVKPRHQELPAVYFVRSLSRIVTYQGNQPWMNDDLEELSPPLGPPWMRTKPKESWIAMVNPDTQKGMGLYSPLGSEFWWVGVTGSAPGGPTSPQTMHMAAIRTMALERDSIVTYRYWLIYGTVESIRERAYQLHRLHPHG